MGAGGPALRGLLVKGIADEAADRGIAAFEARRCGTGAFRSAMPAWIWVAACSASTTLLNSTSSPSPVVFTSRP